jgi:hypothetical protein
MPPLHAKALRAGKRKLSGEKVGPYHQANSGTGQEGTIQSIEEFSDNVK